MVRLSKKDVEEPMDDDGSKDNAGFDGKEEDCRPEDIEKHELTSLPSFYGRSRNNKGIIQTKIFHNALNSLNSLFIVNSNYFLAYFLNMLRELDYLAFF